MAKVTTLVQVSILCLAVMPLVACVCDKTALKKCTDTFVNAVEDVSMQQDFMAMMNTYCRSDILPAILCIIHEGADCHEDTPYNSNSLTNYLKMITVEDLQENCHVISQIPRDARNCLNKALSFNNTDLYECIISASTNSIKSQTQTGTFSASDLCSMWRSAQKCQQNAIASNCPNYKNDLSTLNQLWNKFLKCSDMSSSTGNTSVTAILLTTCFAILRMLNEYN